MAQNTLKRIKQFIDYKGISNASFEKEAGMSNGSFSSQLKNNRTIGVDKLENILNAYPELNPEWLLTGHGNMLKINEVNEQREIYNREPSIKNSTEIPLIPIEAMAGYSSGDSQIMQYDVISGYKIPELEGKGVKYLIRVSGSSMYPKYSNGDLLACKPLQDRAFFQWGKPYVLDTDQGSIVKRLFPCSDDEDCLECRSDNSVHYPPFKIPKDSIRAFAIVVGVIRLE